MKLAESKDFGSKSSKTEASMLESLAPKPADSNKSNKFIKILGVVFNYFLGILVCSLLSFCTSIGFIFRSSLHTKHLGSITYFGVSNAIIFLISFIIYSCILFSLVIFSKSKKAVNFLEKVKYFLISKWHDLTELIHTEAHKKLLRRNVPHFLAKAASAAIEISNLALLCIRWCVFHLTHRQRNLFITFILGWLWAPVTFLAAYGADLCSQIREYSWAWNQITGLKQPYIGFFSFVPADIYPTAHYLWPSNPTYLSDQHNIVLTVIYGSVAAVSRYFTDSNDAGIVLLAFMQFVFAAFCFAATANRFLNRPWLISKYNYDKNNSLRKHNKKYKTYAIYANAETPMIARVIVLLLLLFNPLVILSTISLTKSPLFAFAFTWWVGVCYEINSIYFDKNTCENSDYIKRKSRRKLPIHTIIELVISVSVMLIAAKYAWYILTIQFILLLIAHIKHWKLWLCGILLPTVLIHGSITLLISSGAIINGDPIESRGVQLQQIARIAKVDPKSIPHCAKRAISRIFNLDQAAEAYKPNDADPVKSSGLQSKKVSYRWRYVTKSDIKQLDKAWWKTITNSPLVATDALVAKSYGYFDILDTPYVGPEYYLNTDSIHKSVWIKLWNPRLRSKISKNINELSEESTLRFLIHGNTYVIGTLLIGVAEIILRRWKTVIWHIPLALLMGVMIMAPANNFERHMLPLTFVFCFVLLAFWRDTLKAVKKL